MKRLAERLYEARKMRERVPSEFLPLFDHLLNLAADSAKHGRPQRAGIELRKAEQLAKRKTSNYYDPHTEGGHLHKRTGYRGHRRFGYLNERDLRARDATARDVSKTGDTARFYSGEVTVTLRYVEPEKYRFVVHAPGHRPYKGVLNAPRAGYGRGVAYDSRRAYLKAAKAATSFADNDDPGILDRASWGSEGISFSTYRRTQRHTSRDLRAKARQRRSDIASEMSRDSRKRKTKYPRAVEHKVSHKIALLREEGYSAKQAAAIAYRMYGIGRVGRSTRTTKRRSMRRIYRRRG